MIARTWSGRTRAEDADKYTSYLEETGVGDCLDTDGNLGVLVLRRVRGAEAEFLFISLWASMDDVKGFAGADPDRARYYDEDRTYLLELAPFLDHYEVVVEALPRP